VQRAFENAYTMHDMVGFGAGAPLGVMRDMLRSDIEILRVTPPPRSLPVDYLRGAAYDEYRSDGVWAETPFSERLHDEPVPTELARRGDAVRVRRVAGTANRYFLPLDARDVRAVGGAVEIDELGAIFTIGSERTTEYSFTLGARDRLAPVPPRPLDLRVPRSEREAVTQLAGEWTVGAATDEEKLDAIRNHLRTGYRYSLTETREADDPLLDFLYGQKAGYCTYFASAMVMLSRASGVPARLVTGYRVGEWSPLAGEFVVREKNAHAWVEAWVNGAWRTYDPTPGAALPQDAVHLTSASTFMDDGVQRIGEAVAYAFAHVTPAQLGAVLVVLAALWALVRASRTRAAKAGPGEVAGRFDRPLPCFERLVSALQHGGVVRAPSEPLEGFARRLEQAGFDEASQLVARYAALRYGGLGDPGVLEADVDHFLSHRS
jgi:transglutaminase-like putative cysteine protease